MGCAPTGVIGPNRAARPIGHHYWKKYILLQCGCLAIAELFSARHLGDGTETSSSGVFGQLFGLSRVMSLDLIDLDAHRPGSRASALRQPGIPCCVASGVVGVQVDEAPLDQEVPDLEDVAPP